MDGMTDVHLEDPRHRQLRRISLGGAELPVRVHVLVYNVGAGGDIGELAAEAVGRSAEPPGASPVRDFAGGFIKETSDPTHRSVAVWQKNVARPGYGLPDFYRRPFEPPADGKLTELEIYIVNQKFDVYAAENFLSGHTVLGSQAWHDIEVFTGFQPDPAGRERYLISVTADAAVNRIEAVVDSIIELENSFHLLVGQSLPSGLPELIAEFESGGSELLQAVNQVLPEAGTKELKEWLERLTDDYARLADIHDQLGAVIAETMSLKSHLRQIFQRWREQPIQGITELSQPLLSVAQKQSTDHARLLGKVEAARRRRSDVIKVLRARIDILEREQAYALQSSIHENTRTQIAMEHSIEGLYIFIVAFYLTELAKIIFEALESLHIIEAEPTVLAAAFIPVAIVIGLVLSGRAAEWLKRYANRSWKK